MGQYVTRFEDEIRHYTGAKYAIAVSSGTAALHVALILAEVSPGDEVITQPLTFVATANAISYCSAQPVHVLENKRRTARMYHEFFQNLDVPFVSEPENAQSNYWLNAIVLNDRQERDRVS